MPAPAYPAALSGERAPIMLSVLPTYYEQSLHVREILQAEGLELDDIWAYVRDDWPHLTDPATVPSWARPMWDAMLNITPNPAQSDADRRLLYVAFVNVVRTEQEITDFITLFADVTGADWTLTVSAPDAADIDTGTLGTEDANRVLEGARKVMPVHFTVTVNGAGSLWA